VHETQVRFDQQLHVDLIQLFVGQHLGNAGYGSRRRGSYVSDQNVVGSMCCLVAATAAISGQAIGSSLNHVDLSPNFAGLLFGISNTLMSAAGVISPIIIGLTVTNEVRIHNKTYGKWDAIV